MEEKEITEGNKVLVSTHDDARSLISWQHERYHHLQSLAQGLLGTVLTAIAVIATIATATEYKLPSLPNSPSVYENAALSFPLSISNEAAHSIIIFNYGVSVLLGFSGAVVILVASHRLYTVISSRPLRTGISSQNYVSIVSKDVFQDISNEQGIDSVADNFTKVIKENQNQIDNTDKRFTQGAMRVVVALGLALISFYHYSQCISADVTGLVIMNISLLLPSYISSEVLKKGMGIKQEDLRKEKTELFQELPFDNSPLSRWSVIEENKIERILIVFVQVLSLLSVLFLIISYLNHIIGSAT